ncbi:hypothetical protein M441DRAFT_54189 [Trichoderma asperellum CBS 433.97]|uniref:Uncharacterized protein n=1 Tax=Trichoderma asperellum (strain ATCC 204424 / CBS 433.97 / NBRC 101777) TaxID=1042311 RepID=A0A2T3ZJW5_TRIA4|nr:hypothetical protein M441DRAFT_54189 [Trichoderma asperellum CBS 433.97]PTB45101.1 hypothetical protein M441DRAFT_54189 [Trichoderma asperellum CBS 433.97]
MASLVHHIFFDQAKQATAITLIVPLFLLMSLSLPLRDTPKLLLSLALRRFILLMGSLNHHSGFYPKSRHRFLIAILSTLFDLARATMSLVPRPFSR